MSRRGGVTRGMVGMLLAAAAYGPAAAQTPKRTAGALAVAVGAVEVDGRLDEGVWASAPPADDFTQLSPVPFAAPSQRTEVRFLYDDYALYVGARMHDTAADSILRQLTPRDVIGNADEFGIWFSTYNDGVNGVRFITTPSGVQIDQQLSPAGEDGSWDAVWDVACRVDSSGWTAEFRIPWMAFRFPDTEEQIWGMNCYRSLRRLREESTWQPMDPALFGTLNQGGELLGILDIDPPLRLSIFPYASTYVVAEGGEVATQTNGGMDLKVGLGESFTLDATLVPDFGQVVADNLVLNLSPFELQFDENRPFFREGADLFNRSGLFYSRRIGENARLLNATKISGRTAGGTGLAVLQAWARSQQDSALVSKSVVVVDQNLPNNSYVAATTTFAAHAGAPADALLQAVNFELRDAENAWSFFGSGAVNRWYGAESAGRDEGDRWQVGVSRIKGRLIYSLSRYEESARFDPNALGYLEAPNETVTTANIEYRIFEPFGRFNWMKWSAGADYKQVESPRTFQSLFLYGQWMATTRAFHTWNLEATLVPRPMYNIFASRIEGLAWNEPGWWWANGWFSSDYRRPLAIDVGVWGASGPLYTDWDELSVRLAPRFRFNDNFSVDYVWKVIAKLNERGWADLLPSTYGDDDSPPLSLFGSRDNIERTQVLNLSYIFTNRISLSARIRHSWSQVRYHHFLYLTPSGDLAPLAADRPDLLNSFPGVSPYDLNFNAWSVDLVFRWIFAPGSELQAVWKQNLVGADAGELLPSGYRANFSAMLEDGFTNSFSLRAVYFLDYSRLKQGLRGFQE